jgi:hypothetical protein
MYAGEVNVAQDQLPQFLKTAERLKVQLSPLLIPLYISLSNIIQYPSIFLLIPHFPRWRTEI